MSIPAGIYANRSRDGWSTFQGLAKSLCRISQAFDPILRSKWADSPNVIALLDAVAAICPLIAAAEGDVFDTYNGGDNSAIDNDGVKLPAGRLPDADPIPS